MRSMHESLSQRHEKVNVSSKGNPEGFPLRKPFPASAQASYRHFRFKNRKTAHFAAPPFRQKLAYAVLLTSVEAFAYEISFL